MSLPDGGRRVAGWVGAGIRGSAAGLARGAYGAVRWPDHRVRQVQRRTMRTLVVAQALGGLGSTLGIAVAALLAQRITGSDELAGLAQSMLVIGSAVSSMFLAWLMGRRGRRAGLSLGYVIGAAGAAICVVSGVNSSFGLLLVGLTLLGATTATSNQSRYAATDLARPERRARALSVVVWATTIGAVAGPNLSGVAGRAARALGLPPVTGPFGFGLVVMVAASLVVLVFLRPDPLLVAREAALGRGSGPVRPRSWRRIAEVARTRPAVAAGAVALSLAQAVMISVMVMTPLHMHAGGATLQVIGIVISIHVLGMYAFAPLAGLAADRYGRPLVLSAGSVVFLVSLFLAGTSPMGASYRIGVGLFLLGLGWSMCTVSASTMLSESAPSDVRTDVQGAADLVMGLTAAFAGAVAGLVVGEYGFPALALFSALLVTGIATAAEIARRTTGRLPGEDDIAL